MDLDVIVVPILLVLVLEMTLRLNLSNVWTSMSGLRLTRVAAEAYGLFLRGES